MTHDRVDYVVVFAFDKELQAFLRQLPEYETRRTDIIYYKARVFGAHRRKPYHIVVLGLPQMGNYEASAATTRAIDVWRPRHVLLGGIAGGVKKRGVSLGDVIVADLIVGYEPGKQRDKGLQRRLRTVRPAERLLEVAHDLRPEDWALESGVTRPAGTDQRTLPVLHFGTVVSGEKVIGDAAWMEELSSDVHDQEGSIAGQIAGVEMEAYGTALACYRAPTSPGMLMAKSISDWADSKKNDGWQEYAAATSAAFIIALIEASPFVPGGPEHFPIRKDANPYSSRSKIGLCRRIGDDWEDLADYFDIPLDKRRRFRQGRECQDVWEWLENRKRLDGLPDALKAIERDDLQSELIPA